MRLLLCPMFVLLFGVGSAAAQLQEEKIYTVSEVTIKPEPVMGLTAFQKKWSGRVEYPEDARRNNIQGMVFIEFIVDKDGTIQDAAIRTGLGSGCDEAALEGFKGMTKHTWKPGRKNDQPVKVKMVLPFFFKIIKM
jgi:periplasmic protein TonB